MTNQVTPGKIILGELGDIESGVRQLIRNRPLEVTEVELPSGYALRVPTPDETLRIKGYLIVRRNQVRDYLDVAVLSDRYGIAHAADVLRHIDAYYSDQRDPESEGVATQAVRLSHPYGTTELLEGVVARARKLATESERADVASEVQALAARSGMSKQEFAERIGTSRSRLSTYISGKVVPSAALMVRMRRVAGQASARTAHAPSAARGGTRQRDTRDHAGAD